MKAPDKIYVAISKFMCPGLASSSKLKDNMTEYIRKDALLDWAKEKEDYALTRDVKLAYKTMIDKIESL